MPYRAYNDSRFERFEKKNRDAAERRGKVVRFLREHPLSTSEEIFAATGCGPGNAGGLLKAPFYNGHRVYRLDNAKVDKFLTK